MFAIILLTLPFMVLLPSMGDFPFRSANALYTDYAVTHYPNAVFLKDSLWAYHQIPFWSPTILSGYPFFANPLSGLLYPPGWLALIFPLPFGFNLILALHLVFGGYGMFQLMKKEGLSHWAALFSGLGFALLPKIFAHYGAGHLTLLYAITWTPWLLLCQANGAGFGKESRKFLIPAGIILGIIFLADVRWFAYAGVLWVAYSIAHRYDELWRVTLLRMVVQAGLACLVAAPLALPLIEYTLLSSRVTMGVEQVGAFSLPFANLVGVLFPDFHGNHEWVIYAGGTGLALALLAVMTSTSHLRVKFWGVVVLLSLIFALGEALPGFIWLAQIPGFDLLRAPSRAIFLAGIGLTALAGCGIEFIHTPSRNESHRSANLALVALAALTLAFGIVLFLLEGGWILNITWGIAFGLAGVAWVMLGLKERFSPQIWLAGVVCLAILDWGGVARLSFTPRSAQTVTEEQSSVAGYLAAQAGTFRIYSPSYSLPQQTAAEYHLQLADGVDPMQLERYADYMVGASGVPRMGYQVTIPTFANGDPPHDNAAYLPDINALGNLNVAYIVSEFDISLEGLNLVEKEGETRIYRNQAFQPRAWVQPAGSPPGVDSSEDPIITWTPNRIEVTAKGVGWLVMSEIAYPGWQVSVDGKKQALLDLQGLFRGVELDAGSHQIIFTFVPWTLYLGILIPVVGVSAWWIYSERAKREKGSPKVGFKD